MWRKAFIILVSINLLVIVSLTVWWSTLPKAQSPQAKVPPQPVASGAPVQISIGQDAVNSYLEYFLSRQKDLKNVLSYARIKMGQNWNVQLGAKLSDRIVPLNVTIVPTVLNGNLQLHMTSADVGQVPVPTATLFLVLRRLHWPNWITLDSLHQNINLNFSKRPQTPYGVQILKYDEQTKMLTLKVTIAPKSLAGAKLS